MEKLRSLHQLLNNGSINRLLEHIRHLQMLDSCLHACLDAEISPHIQIADHQAERLIITAESAAWATRLRYLTPRLLLCLQRSPALATLQRIEIRIAPLTEPPARPVRPVVLSAASAELITSTAEHLTNPALRAALKRLARRHSGKSFG